MDRFREVAGFRPKIDFECDDWHAKQVLVASAAGVMFFPGLALPSARDDIVLRPTTPDRPATGQPMLDLLHGAARDDELSGQESR